MFEAHVITHSIGGLQSDRIFIWKSTLDSLIAGRKLLGIKERRCLLSEDG